LYLVTLSRYEVKIKTNRLVGCSSSRGASGRRGIHDIWLQQKGRTLVKGEAGLQLGTV
jgi:hypothetical protein